MLFVLTLLVCEIFCIFRFIWKREIKQLSQLELHPIIGTYSRGHSWFRMISENSWFDWSYWMWRYDLEKVWSSRIKSRYNNFFSKLYRFAWTRFSWRQLFFLAWNCLFLISMFIGLYSGALLTKIDLYLHRDAIFAALN